MKWFALLLSYIIFLTLITNSAQSTAVDDSGGNEMVSEDVDKLNAVPTKDSKYKIYLNTVVRNTQGELISVAETLPCQFTNCSDYLAHEITDYAFDTLLGKKEIITIYNIKYEKVHLSNSYEVKEVKEQTARWVVELCGEPVKKYGLECAKIFHNKTTVVYLEVGDVITTNWTILRELN